MPALQQVSGAPSAVWMDSCWTTGAGKQRWTEHSTLVHQEQCTLSVCLKMPLAWVSINTVSLEVARLGVSTGETELCFSRHVLSSGRSLIPTLCQLLPIFLASLLLLLPFLVVRLSLMFCTYPAACSKWDMSISLEHRACGHGLLTLAEELQELQYPAVLVGE